MFGTCSDVCSILSIIVISGFVVVVVVVVVVFPWSFESIVHAYAWIWESCTTYVISYRCLNFVLDRSQSIRFQFDRLSSVFLLRRYGFCRTISASSALFWFGPTWSAPAPFLFHANWNSDRSIRVGLPTRSSSGRVGSRLSLPCHSRNSGNIFPFFSSTTAFF